MNSRREHLLQQLHRRLNVRNARLHTPWPKAGHIDPFPHCQRQILVPRHEPIRICRLVEVNRSHRSRHVAHVRTNQLEQLFRHSQPGYCRHIEQPAPARRGQRAQCRQQTFDFRVREQIRHNAKAMLLDIAVHSRVSLPHILWGGRASPRATSSILRVTSGGFHGTSKRI